MIIITILAKLVPLFVNEQMTLDELISFSDDEEYFKNYLTELNIPKSSQWRILSSIKRTKQARLSQNNQENKMDDSKNDHNNDISQRKISRVRVTDEEDEAINDLEKYNENLLSLITELNALNDAVIHNEQQTKSKINAQFNKLINTISNKQEQVFKELNQLSKQKSMEINTKIKQIEEKQKQAENAKLTCYTTIENSNIDRKQRKKTIISTANSITSEKMPTTITDICTKFMTNFNAKSIETFVDNLVDINDERKAKEQVRLTELSSTQKQGALAMKNHELETAKQKIMDIEARLEKVKKEQQQQQNVYVEKEQVHLAELKTKSKELAAKQTALEIKQQQLEEAHRKLLKICDKLEEMQLQAKIREQNQDEHSNAITNTILTVSVKDTMIPVKCLVFSSLRKYNKPFKLTINCSSNAAIPQLTNILQKKLNKFLDPNQSLLVCGVNHNKFWKYWSAERS
eukprot:475496_1